MRCTFVALMLICTGCSDGSPRRYPVQGKVVFPDGEVLKQGTVEFQSLGREPPVTATGSIQPDGRFEMETMSQNDGAIIGRHRVIVVGEQEVGTSEERPWKLSKSPVHQRYADFKTSGLEVTVEPKRNVVELAVDYAADR